MAKRVLWSREEMILALNLYLKTQFGKIHSKNPNIIHLANLTGRSVNSISLRLANFASIDPFQQQRGIKGMAGGSKQCEPYWNEFINNKEALIFESEQILAKYERHTIEDKFNSLLSMDKHLVGEERINMVKTRVNQQVFREMVLTNYGNKCVITKICMPELLVASHIVPWSINQQERLNPANGICFSNLYDKAFDKGLISLDNNYRILLSDKVLAYKNEPFYKQHFGDIQHKKIIEHIKCPPHFSFLEYHRDNIFNKVCV